MTQPANAGGFYKVEETGGVWWFAKPDGERVLSIGVNSVHPQGDHCPDLGYSEYRRFVTENYENDATWTDEAHRRLTDWGFNTIGSFSQVDLFADKNIALTTNVGISGADWLTGSFPDVFSDEFERKVLERARTVCGEYKDNRDFLGYFLDNELSWTPDWRTRLTMLERYVKLPASSAGKNEVCRFFEERYGDFNSFRNAYETDARSFEELGADMELKPKDAARFKADGNAFLALVADAYFKKTTDAIRSVDPNHLILGARFVSWLTRREPLEACARYCDVISLQHYILSPVGEMIVRGFAGDSVSTEDDFAEFYELAEKPLLISEFGFRARDSGLPNTLPPLMRIYDTQRERADAYRETVSSWASRSYIAGFHVFEYCDQPALGRFDGENSNWGIVNVRDEPYREYTEMMTVLHPTLGELHGRGGDQGEDF
ncbi:MAG: hypothetical protein NUW37_09385 [Planctomycetes bacterium]|nr:hypothetical protein [Planctomycetota bacterium]